MISHPTTIIHGLSDDVVPIEYSRRVAARNNMIELIEVEDSHRLSESLHYIPLAVERVLSH
jgi:pimeloyl-ACP methyl ester carboxylesterase